LIKLPLIHLDAGHGGTDGGALGNGLKEKDLTLDICKRIQAGLLANYEGVKVSMSRSDDTFLSLDERARKANAANADVFVSVHINSAVDQRANGFESYTYTNVDSGTIAFQNVMHEQIMRTIGSGITDRGKKKANFAVLRGSKMKAILTENLFIVNPTEAKLLGSPDFRQKIADGHIIGLERFLGLKRASLPPPPKAEKLYRVQVGAFEDKENAEAMVKDLEKAGYRPFIRYE
jgi:N-acetylmuramoyl-L-alanine amidase